MRRSLWLAVVLGVFLPVVGLWAQTAAPTTNSEQPTVTSPQQVSEDASALYEQASGLSLLRGLALTDDQLKQLLPLLQSARDQRQNFLTQAATLWQQADATVQSALAAPGGPATVAAADPTQVRATVAAYGNLQALLQQSQDNLAAQFLALLTPAQAAAVEGAGQAEQRRQVELQLGGAHSVPEYLAGQMDTLRALAPPEYFLLRHWLSRHWAALLRSPDVPGFDYLTGRLLSFMDQTVALPPDAYAAQYDQVPDLLAQYLGLPAAVQTVFFDYSYVELLIGSDQSLAVVQRLLDSPPSGVPEPDPAVQQAADQLAAGADRLALTDLIEALRLTPGQVRAVSALVGPGAGRDAAREQAAALAPDRLILEQIRDALLPGATLPEDLAPSWSTLRDREQQRQREAQAQMVATLLRLQDLLTVDQAALIDWPPAPATATDTRAGQLQDLRQIAAEMQRGYDFLVGLRFQRMALYLRTRVLRTREFVSQYFPPDSPAAPVAFNLALSYVSQAKTTKPPAWDSTWPRLVTDLMIGLGAVPSPWPLPQATRPLSWEQVEAALTSEAAPAFLAALASSAPQ